MRFVKLSVLAAVMAVAAVLASTAQAHTNPKIVLPPGGVYTCPWIAEHPVEAALAMVSCNDSPPTGGFQRLPSGPDANGCQSVPNGGGYIGQGVFAWSQYEYATYWEFASDNVNAAYYTWYIQKTDGTNVWHEIETDTLFHTHTVAANIYRAGAQNHSSTPDKYTTCYFT